MVQQEDIVDELHQLERGRRLVVYGVVQLVSLMEEHVLVVAERGRRRGDG